MNQSQCVSRILMVFSVALLAASASGNSTNIIGETNVDFDSLDFTGETNGIAANLTTVTSFTSVDTGYLGGSGNDVISSGAVANSGGIGLNMTTVTSADISNTGAGDKTAVGGDGGSIISTAAGSDLLESLGGDGVKALRSTTTINNFDVTGGNGGYVESLAANIVQSTGGFGVRAVQGVALTVTNSTITGGDGGNVWAKETPNSIDANGGNGIQLGGVTIRPLYDGVYAYGGNGGSVVNDGVGGSVNVSGGIGLFAVAQRNLTEVNGGIFVGGSGGSLIAQNNSNEVSTANGGGGIVYVGLTSVATDKLIIRDGQFTGGDGGSVTDADAGSQADGGNGIAFVDAEVDILGGTFIGGAAGTVNGQVGRDGFGIRIQDTIVDITNGTFSGSSAIYTTSVRDGNDITIHDGQFDGDATFLGNNILNIYGGDFGGDFVFGDIGFNDAFMEGIDFNDLMLLGSGTNNLALNGGSFSDLLISGEGYTKLSLTNVTSSGSVVVFGGETDINHWSDGNFVSVTLSNGILNFNNLDYALSGSLSMEGEDTQVNISNDAEVSGTLGLDLGSFNVTSNLTVKSGAELSSAVQGDGAGGLVGGLITADSAVFEDNVSWTVVNLGSTNVTAENFADGIKLVTSANSISNNFDFSDFTLENNPEWLLGINGVTNEFDGSSYNLIATYGELQFEKVFEDYPEIKGVIDQLAPILATNDALRAHIGSAWNDVQDAATDLGEGYTRAPEMANSLISVQGVIADQIKGRTRSNLRSKNFGSKTAYSPSGPSGPQWYENTVQWTKDVLPSWNASDDARKLDDRAPKVNQSEVVKTGASTKGGGSKVAMPETWQVWGGAYVSGINQDATTGHVGYDATIVGGMIAVDKRFEKMLVGLGGGYANTTLDGNEGNDGDADTLYASAYWAHNSESFYVDASLTYGYNDVSTEGVEEMGYEAEYDAHTLGFGLGVGYGISFAKDKWLFTPEASYLGTMFSRSEYSEKSTLATPFPTKEYESYDYWSHLTSIGATLSMIGVYEALNTQLELQPEFRAHWLHEFNADLDDDGYLMVGGTGELLPVALQAREEDLIRLGAGVRVSEWGNDTTEFSFDLDGAFGADYQDYIVSGKIIHRF